MPIDSLNYAEPKSLYVDGEGRVWYRLPDTDKAVCIFNDGMVSFHLRYEHAQPIFICDHAGPFTKLVPEQGKSGE